MFENVRTIHYEECLVFKVQTLLPPDDTVECVLPMVNWPEFRMGQYRDDDHRENAPRFILPLKIRLSNDYGEKNFISIVVDRSTALIEVVILGTDKASHRDSVT